MAAVSLRAATQWFLILVVGCLVACSSSSNRETATGKGSIRAIHAISNIGNVSFLIEETTLASLSYKEVSGTSQYDDLEYDFSFEITLPGDDDETELAVETVSVDAETEYLFVLRGTLEDPEILLWQQFGRDWAEELEDAEDNDTEVKVMEVSFGHLDPDLEPIDIYLESPGTSPVFATPLGTIGDGELLPATELTADTYQLVITPQGDPDTILFASGDLSFSAAASNLFTIMDSAGLTTDSFSVRRVGTASDLTNLFAESEVEMLHAAFGTEPVDIIVDGDFSNPLVSDLDYSSLVRDIPIDDGSITLTVVPADNPGVFLAQRQVNITAGTFNQLFLVGLPGQIGAVSLTSNEQTLATHTRLQIFQAAARFPTLDLYLVDEDVDITLTSASLSSFSFGTSTGTLSREEGVYNLFLTDAGTKNVIGGPYQLVLEKDRIYSVVIVDSQSITAAEILFFDRTPE